MFHHGILMWDPLQHPVRGWVVQGHSFWKYCPREGIYLEYIEYVFSILRRISWKSWLGNRRSSNYRWRSDLEMIISKALPRPWIIFFYPIKVALAFTRTPGDWASTVRSHAGGHQKFQRLKDTCLSSTLSRPWTLLLFPQGSSLTFGTHPSCAFSSLNYFCLLVDWLALQNALLGHGCPELNLQSRGVPASCTDENRTLAFWTLQFYWS